MQQCTCYDFKVLWVTKFYRHNVWVFWGHWVFDWVIAIAWLQPSDVYCPSPFWSLPQLQHRLLHQNISNSARSFRDFCPIVLLFKIQKFIPNNEYLSLYLICMLESCPLTNQKLYSSFRDHCWVALVALCWKHSRLSIRLFHWHTSVVRPALSSVCRYICHIVDLYRNSTIFSLLLTSDPLPKAHIRANFPWFLYPVRPVHMNCPLFCNAFRGSYYGVKLARQIALSFSANLFRDFRRCRTLPSALVIKLTVWHHRQKHFFFYLFFFQGYLNRIQTFEVCLKCLIQAEFVRWQRFTVSKAIPFMTALLND